MIHCVSLRKSQPTYSQGWPPTCLGDQRPNRRQDDDARTPQNRSAPGGWRYNGNPSDLEYWRVLPSYTSHSPLRPAGYHGDRLGSSVPQPSGAWACSDRGQMSLHSPWLPNGPVTRPHPLFLVPEKAEPFGWAGAVGRPNYISQESPGTPRFRSRAAEKITRRPVRGYLGL